jgi:hypothetical protein
MKLAKRTPRHVPNVETDSTHPLFTGQRKRSFGFHNPQRNHAPKVQHPKPTERVAA